MIKKLKVRSAFAFEGKSWKTSARLFCNMTKQNLTRGKLLERNSKTVDTVIEFWRKNEFPQINTPMKRKLQVMKNQRVLYKISHLTISSLVLISNKRQGQLILYYQLETIHLRWKRGQLRETFADKVMLECCYQLCAFASADSKSKVEPCGACISFIQLRLVVFMIECDKVGFSISFPSVVFVRKSRLRKSLGQQFTVLFISHLFTYLKKVIIVTE